MYVILSPMYSFFVFVSDGGYYKYEVDRVVPPVVNSLHHARQQNLPVVVWWNPFTGDRAGKIKRCERGDCHFSTNRSLYNDTSFSTKVFMFYGTDFNVDDLPLPRKGE